MRRLTADHFYVRLLEENDIISRLDELDSALHFLLEAPWDSDMTIQESSELSSRIAQMIGITLKSKCARKLAVDDSPKKHRVVDEFDSYASLVNSS